MIVLLFPLEIAMLIENRRENVKGNKEIISELYVEFLSNFFLKGGEEEGSAY